jgi:hypothetical protein
MLHRHNAICRVVRGDMTDTHTQSTQSKRRYSRFATKEDYKRAERRLHEWERILDERLAAGLDTREAWARVDGYRQEVASWDGTW